MAVVIHRLRTDKATSVISQIQHRVSRTDSRNFLQVATINNEVPLANRPMKAIWNRWFFIRSLLRSEILELNCASISKCSVWLISKFFVHRVLYTNLSMSTARKMCEGCSDSIAGRSHSERSSETQVRALLISTSSYFIGFSLAIRQQLHHRFLRILRSSFVLYLTWVLICFLGYDAQTSFSSMQNDTVLSLRPISPYKKE